MTWRPWYKGCTIWPVLLCVGLGVAAAGKSAPEVKFPVNKFPVNLVERNAGRLGPAGGVPRRVFSSDQWSDYLIFQLYPKVRVYFDGRSDFFGPWRGKSYLDLMGGEPDSPAILDREHVEFALVPRDWALAGLLRGNSQWRAVDSDNQAVLFERDFPKDALITNQKERNSR